MKINSLKIITGATVAAVVSLMAVSAFAQSDRPLINALKNGAQQQNASTTAKLHEFANKGQAILSSSTVNELKKVSDANIEQRIDRLNVLTNRIEDMKKISTSSREAILNSLSSSTQQLENYKTQIDNATNTSELKGIAKSVLKDTRVYNLILPQAEIVSAGSRIITTANLLMTITDKIQSRISASSTVIQVALTGAKNQITDAITLANAAITEVNVLKPDMGSTTVAASNKTALKDARQKLVSAQKDLGQAKSDLSGIVANLRSNHQ
jgi:hypothetical protein